MQDTMYNNTAIMDFDSDSDSDSTNSNVALYAPFTIEKTTFYPPPFYR